MRTGAPDGVLTDAPPGLTAAVRETADAGAHVFQPQPWGSWFEYAVPDVLVAIDSRIELFPPEVWDQYEQVVAGVDGWEEQLATWEVELVVVDADQTGFRALARGRRLGRRRRGRRRGRHASTGRLRVVTSVDRAWLAKRGHAYARVLDRVGLPARFLVIDLL